MGRYGTVRRHIGDEAVYPKKLGLPLVNGSYIREYFNYQPLLTGPLGHGAPSGVDTESFIAHLKNGGNFLGTYIGTGTQLGPRLVDGRLQISLDEAAEDGVEYNPGISQLGATCYGPMVLTRGATPPHFVRAKFTVVDVSEISQCALGYRVEGAVNAVFDDYEDLGAITLNNGNVETHTISDNDATVVFDTLQNVGNGVEFELKAVLTKNFGIRSFLNGREYGSEFAIHADVTRVIPFIHLFQVAAGAGSVISCSELEAGYLADVDDHYIL